MIESAEKTEESARKPLSRRRVRAGSGPPPPPDGPEPSKPPDPSSEPPDTASPDPGPSPFKSAAAMAANPTTVAGRAQPVEPLPKPVTFDMEPELFFKYWAALLPHEKERALIYPYRVWPVCDVTQTLTDEELAEIRQKKRSAPQTNLGKLHIPFDPKQWKQEILHRFGSGDYHFKLNDIHPQIRRTVCMTTVVGLRDLDHYPPDINLRELVVSDPANKSYIRWAQLKGLKIPGVDGTYGEEDDMGNEAIKSMMGTVERLTDKLVNGADARATASTKNVDPLIHSSLRAAEVVADAAKQGNAIIADSLKRSQEMQNKAADPQQYFKDVTDAARSMVPQNNGGAGFAEAMGVFTTFMQMLQAQHTTSMQMYQAQTNMVIEELRGRIKMSEAMIESARAKPADTSQTPAAEAGKPRSLLAQVKEARELFDILTPAGSDDGVPKWVPWAVRGAAVVMNGISSLVYNSKLQPGQQAQPPADLTALMDEGGGGTVEEPPPVQSINEEENLMNFVKNLEQPLLSALREGKTGTQFAAEVIIFQSDMVYAWMCEQGDAKLIQYLQSYPPLWSQLIKIPDRFTRFLEEFLDEDRARKLAAQLRARMAASQPIPTGQPRRPQAVVDAQSPRPSQQPPPPPPPQPAASQPPPQAIQPDPPPQPQPQPQPGMPSRPLSRPRQQAAQPIQLQPLVEVEPDPGKPV